MSEKTEMLCILASDKAYRRTPKQRIVSFGKAKLHKWTKPKNIVKTVATGAIAAIPIPGVGVAADWVKEKALQYVGEKWHQRRLDQARSQRDGGGLEEEYKALKFEIKDFDISGLDTARRKAMRTILAYNQLLAPDPGKSPCERAYNLAYRLSRAQCRVGRLRALAETMQQLGSDLVAFCGEVERPMQNAWERMPEELDLVLAGNHAMCKKSGCIITEEGERALENNVLYVPLLGNED